MTLVQFFADHGLDFFTTALGLLYIILEYRASIWLWLVGIVMPALDIYLYWSHGLYGDAGMAAYYTAAAVYGLLVWKFGSLRLKERPAADASAKTSEPSSITHFPLKRLLPTLMAFLAIWAVVYFVLINYTDSTIPMTDSFTNALSFIGLWALARKYVEQWFIWIVVDAVSCYLYIVKGIPFKALLYGLYVVIAIFGYMKWLKMIQKG